MIDYKDRCEELEEKDFVVVFISGACFFGALALLAVLFLLIGA